MFSKLCGPLIATLFPYTTLFRSPSGAAGPATPTSRQSARTSQAAVRSSSTTPTSSEPFQGFGRNASTPRSEEHTSELQSLAYLVCRLLLEKKNIRTPLVYTCFLL